MMERLYKRLNDITEERTVEISIDKNGLKRSISVPVLDEGVNSKEVSVFVLRGSRDVLEQARKYIQENIEIDLVYPKIIR